MNSNSEESKNTMLPSPESLHELAEGLEETLRQVYPCVAAIVSVVVPSAEEGGKALVRHDFLGAPALLPYLAAASAVLLVDAADAAGTGRQTLKEYADALSILLPVHQMDSLNLVFDGAEQVVRQQNAGPSEDEVPIYAPIMNRGEDMGGYDLCQMAVEIYRTSLLEIAPDASALITIGALPKENPDVIDVLQEFFGEAKAAHLAAAGTCTMLQHPENVGYKGKDIFFEIAGSFGSILGESNFSRYVKAVADARDRERAIRVRSVRSHW